MVPLMKINGDFSLNVMAPHIISNFGNLDQGFLSLSLLPIPIFADTQWDAYFNNKIDYTFHQLSTTIEDVYREMMQNDCRLNREILI